MTYRIPQQGKFSQPNRGDLSGNLNRTVGVDLQSNPGRLRLAARLTLNTKDNDTGITGMGLPIAFLSIANKYYALTGIGTTGGVGSGKVLVSASDSPASAFANDTTSNSPTTINAGSSDAVVWNPSLYGLSQQSALIVSTLNLSGNFSKLHGGVWDNDLISTFGIILPDGYSTLNLCPAFNRNLYIFLADKVKFVVPSTDGAIPPVATNSGPGTLDFHNAYYPIWGMSNSDSVWISLMSNDSNIGARGFMAKWNTVGTTPQLIIDINAPSAVAGTVCQDTPYILDAFGILKKYGGTGFIEVARLPVANGSIEMPGIYDHTTNLRWVHPRGISTVKNKIRINVNNFVSTGVYVNDMPSGIWEFDTENPSLGLYHIDAPCADTTDFGQQLINIAGAVSSINRSAGSILAGYSYFNDSGLVSRYGIFHDDITGNQNKHAIVAYPFLPASVTKDNFNDFILRFSKMDTTDSVRRKYRHYRNKHMPFITSATWTAANTLTSPDDSTQQYASIGDEVEVVMGIGSSTTAHITDISAAGGIYTIVLDEAIGQSSGTCKIKVDNFRDLLTANDIGSIDAVTQIPGEAATRLQPKIEIRASGDFELDDMTITNVKDY